MTEEQERASALFGSSPILGHILFILRVGSLPDSSQTASYVLERAEGEESVGGEGLICPGFAPG